MRHGRFEQTDKASVPVEGLCRKRSLGRSFTRLALASSNHISPPPGSQDSHANPSFAAGAIEGRRGRAWQADRFELIAQGIDRECGWMRHLRIVTAIIAAPKSAHRTFGITSRIGRLIRVIRFGESSYATKRVAMACLRVRQTPSLCES